MGKWIEFRGTKLFVYRQQEDFLFACELVEKERFYFWVNEKNKRGSLLWSGMPVVRFDGSEEDQQEMKAQQEELQKKSILWSMWEDRAVDFFKELYSVMAAALPKNE